MPLPQGCRMADTLTPLHFDRMEALELTCYGPEFITPAAESYRLYRRFPYTTVAALAGEEIAGFITLHPSNRYDGDCLYVVNLNISEEYRRKGVQYPACQRKT